ncbi:MAG: CPBP family intramembrane glutamic endopeptidase [Phycisphaerae bacterium]
MTLLRWPLQMARARSKSSSNPFRLFAGGAATRDGYGEVSKQPLQVLWLLLPFLVLYELGSILYLQHPSEGMRESIAAYSFVERIFRAFGVASFHIPAILLAASLVGWHVARRDPTVVRLPVLFTMFVESVLWTFPLLMLGLLLQSRPGLIETARAVDITALPWQARLTLSAGAGLYEELLFRLVGITLVQFILSRLMAAKPDVAATIAVFVSAIAFAIYHRTTLPGGGADLTLLTYYGLAGLYFGSLFIFRGFGIVAATHFLFDALVLVAIPAAGTRT